LNGRESVQVFYRLFIYMYYRWKPVALYQEGSFGIPLTGFVSPRHIFVPGFQRHMLWSYVTGPDSVKGLHGNFLLAAFI
jgi:hypothetical protein